MTVIDGHLPLLTPDVSPGMKEACSPSGCLRDMQVFSGLEGEEKQDSFVINLLYVNYY